MKKATFILVVFMLVFSAEQASAQLGFQLGIKGGPNFSSVQTDLDSDGRTGFHAGAFVMLKFTKIAIQPEIIFSTQGFSQNFTDPTGIIGNIESEFNTSYVNIPIIVKFYLIGGLNLQFGPQFGFNTFSEFTSLGNTEDIRDELKSSDVSLTFGAGIDLPFKLSLTARHNLGISDINDTLDLGLGAAGDDTLRNQVFQVSVGYAFIKKK